jgi:small-conductance mechanosensitive channel
MLDTLPAFAETWPGRVALAVVATVVMWVIGGAIRAVLEKVALRVTEYVNAVQSTQRTTAVFIRGFGLRAVVVATRLLRLGATLALVYVWFTLVAYFVDPTHHLGPRLVRPVWEAAVSMAETLVGLVPNLLILGLIVFVTRLVLDGVRTVADAVAEGTVALTWLPAELALPTRRLVNLGIVMTAIMLGLPYVPGSDSKTVQAFSIVLGVLVSFGSSSVVSNVMAGLVLTYSRAFRIGDRVRIGDVLGDVTHLGVFTTHIRTLKDEEVVVPNAVVQNAAWTNFARYATDTGVQVSTQVTIGYNVEWRQVHKLLVDAALKTEGIERTPEPYVLQKALEDFYVRYQINAFCRRPGDLHFVEARLCQNIQDSFFAAGVEIMSPHYESFRDGGKLAIPDSPTGPPPQYPLPGEGTRSHRPGHGGTKSSLRPPPTD